MLSVHLQLSVEQFLNILKAIPPLALAIAPLAFRFHGKWKGRKDKRGADDDAAL